jgi:hypothetical protein
VQVRSVLCLFLAVYGHLILAGEPSALDSKLEEQWRRYDEARKFGVEHCGGPTTISRSTWEALLQVQPPFSRSELRELEQRQTERAEKAKQANEKASVLALERLRHLGIAEIRRFCEDLPKGGMLHIHPGGTVDESTLERIAQATRPVIHLKQLVGLFASPTEKSGILYSNERALLEDLLARYGDSVSYETMTSSDKRALRSIVFLRSGSHSFARFQGGFAIADELTPIRPGVDVWEMVYSAFLARAHAEKVTYIEFSTNWSNDGLERWTAEHQAKYDLTLRFLPTFNRLLPAPFNLERIKRLLALPPSWPIVGINIAWDETNAPLFEQGQAIYLPLLKARQEGKTSLHATAHAGEMGDVRNPRDAMLFGVERLGHGVTLRKDPVALEYASLHAMPVEINLTSNLRLQGVSSMAEHPFLYFLRLGLRPSLSTDDEGVLGTDNNQECVTARGWD